MEQNPRRIGTIIWAALVAGVTLFLGVALFVPMPGAPGLVPVLLPVAGGLSLLTTAVSWLWAVRMRAPPSPPPRLGGAIPPGPEAFALTRLIVASALCESGALLALVMFLVTRDAVTLAPFAVSYVALLAHFPGDRHWARLTGAPAGTARGTNRMIRG